MNCKVCNNENIENAKYCVNCGEKLKGETDNMINNLKKTHIESRLLWYVPSLMLFIAIFDLPSNYYLLMRIIVFLSSLIISYNLYIKNESKYIIGIFLGIAILFNPILSFYFDKMVWIILDIILSIWFVIYANINNEKINMKKIKDISKKFIIKVKDVFVGIMGILFIILLYLGATWIETWWTAAKLSFFGFDR